MHIQCEFWISAGTGGDEIEPRGVKNKVKGHRRTHHGWVRRERKFLKPALLEWLKMHLPDLNLTNYYTAQNRQFDDSQKNIIDFKKKLGRGGYMRWGMKERKGDLCSECTSMQITRS